MCRRVEWQQVMRQYGNDKANKNIDKRLFLRKTDSGFQRRTLFEIGGFMFRKNYQYKRLKKCLIRKFINNPVEFFKYLKSWRHYTLCKGYEKETITTKDFKYKSTKKITRGGGWLKIRNNIMIIYCPPSNGDCAVKLYYLINDNSIVMLRQKFLEDA